MFVSTAHSLLSCLAVFSYLSCAVSLSIWSYPSAQAHPLIPSNIPLSESSQHVQVKSREKEEIAGLWLNAGGVRNSSRCQANIYKSNYRTLCWQAHAINPSPLYITLFRSSLQWDNPFYVCWLDDRTCHLHMRNYVYKHSFDWCKVRGH